MPQELRVLGVGFCFLIVHLLDTPVQFLLRSGAEGSNLLFPSGLALASESSMHVSTTSRLPCGSELSQMKAFVWGLLHKPTTSC